MHHYQLSTFDRKTPIEIATLLLRVAISLACLGAFQVVAQPIALGFGANAKTSATQSALWTEYCPDNTCEVLRTYSTVDRQKFRILSLAYFYYFSPYEYLKEWQKDPFASEVVDEELRKLSSGKCSSLKNKDFAACELNQFHKTHGLNLLFIRYEAGKVYSTRQTLPEIR